MRNVITVTIKTTEKRINEMTEILEFSVLNGGPHAEYALKVIQKINQLKGQKQ